ncbi:MAG: helicase, partial [Verrucomicrobiae bacterium]|nr:helicase [Verrucomicrobiae bacterium]
MWEYLEYLKSRRSIFRNLPRIRAFEELREGQESIEKEIKEASDLSRIVFFQAPTGFGKTGVALELALNEVVEGRFDRVAYLTSKSSGQPQVMKQLKTMLPANGALSSVQVRNKDELCTAPLCRCDLEDKRLAAGDRWKSCGLSPLHFISNPVGQPRRFRETGEQERICPYELMRATMPYAEIWVGDMNYLFSPRNRSLFFEQPGFDLSRTLLILDEVHNLASRVADVFSYQIAHDTLERWLAELQFANSH